MEILPKKFIEGYQRFREKYSTANAPLMHELANHGQQPEMMVISCCDSRVDPALILQCEPGDLFAVRNVANIVPPYEADERHHGTSAALEFGVCYLNVKHLIIWGHSQCGGINALLNQEKLQQNDFITRWVSLIEEGADNKMDPDLFAEEALKLSYQNCLTFPWIKERVENQSLRIHLWFFDIKQGEIQTYSFKEDKYQPLSLDTLTME